MSELYLNVILDGSLKPVKPVKPVFSNQSGSKKESEKSEEAEEESFKKEESLKNQLSLDRQNPSNYYSQYEHTENLLSLSENQDNKNYRNSQKYHQTDHHLVNGFLYAYNNHLPLKIRPDDIQLIIQSVLAVCVNNNTEKFRSLFVSHEGKMKISVENATFDPNFFCEIFSKAMTENLKDPVFVEKFTPKFSTTTPIIQTVSNMMLMNTLKEYFSYEMILGCGIPNVILCGSQGDWKTLSENYVYFKIFFKGTELDNWFKHFDTIIEMFLEMRMLAVSGTVQPPNHIKELWKRVISYVPQGSGGDRILGGWIRLLIPYTGANKLIGGLDRKIKCLDLNIPDPILEKYGKGQVSLEEGRHVGYDMQDKLKDFYIANGWSTVPKSNVLTPAVLIDYDETEYQVEFASGFYESAFIDGCVSMNIGFRMTENMTMKTEAKRAFYIEKGVIDDKYGLNVPRALRFEIEEIKKAFDSHGWSFYGIDPKEEEEKKKYLDQGVILSSRQSKTLKIPGTLKDQEEYIRKLFEVSEYVESEYL